MALLMCVAFLSGYNFYDCSTSLVSQWDIARAAWGSLLKYTIPYTHSSQPPYLEAAHPPPCRIEDGWMNGGALPLPLPQQHGAFLRTYNERTYQKAQPLLWLKTLKISVKLLFDFTASRILSSILCEEWKQNYLVFYFTMLPNLR